MGKNMAEAAIAEGYERARARHEQEARSRRIRTAGIAGAVVLVIALMVAASTDGYWYCWDRGYAQPHRLGRPNSADHLCSHWEVWTNGNPTRPTR